MADQESKSLDYTQEEDVLELMEKSTSLGDWCDRAQLVRVHNRGKLPDFWDSKINVIFSRIQNNFRPKAKKILEE